MDTSKLKAKKKPAPESRFTTVNVYLLVYWKA